MMTIIALAITEYADREEHCHSFEKGRADEQGAEREERRVCRQYPGPLFFFGTPHAPQARRVVAPRVLSHPGLDQCSEPRRQMPVSIIGIGVLFRILLGPGATPNKQLPPSTDATKKAQASGTR